MRLIIYTEGAPVKQLHIFDKICIIAKNCQNIYTMDMKNTFATRLHSLRIMKGYSFRELSNAMGNVVSSQTLANYESKVSFPNSDIMSSLLHALGVSYDDIFKPIRVQRNNIEFSFRKKQSLSKKIDESIRQIAINKAEKVLEIEDVLNITSKSLPAIDNIDICDYSDAETFAEIFRKTMGLGDSPIPNIYILLNQMGIKVFTMDLDERFDALNFSYDGKCFVIVNTKLDSNERTRFTLLHEVGHILMKFPESLNDKLVAKLCHRFASNVLLPPSVLAARLGQKRVGIAPQELAYIQSEYGISIRAIMLSARDQGIITDGNLSAFYKKCNALPRFKEYVDKSRFCQEELESVFESLVYRALSSEIISVSKAAYLLGEPIDEVSNHISVL